MTDVVSVRAARAIMSERLHVADEDIPIPYPRAMLYEFVRMRMSLIHIPAGSLVDFPKSLVPVHREEDIAFEQAFRWVATTAPDTFVTINQRANTYCGGMSLEAQRMMLSTEEVMLSPYEIACIASHWAKRERGTLFSGQVRTEQWSGFGLCHLHSHPLTIIMSFDARGRLALNRGYASQVAPHLGIMAGRRRIMSSF